MKTMETKDKIYEKADMSEMGMLSTLCQICCLTPETLQQNKVMDFSGKYWW